ncbi:conserved Plasmodium protein, unknown function [Plasmodium knowlesi strain H]|uniref:Tetratricopeptide repeat protein n=3 Tax=Plasmodium knowlesi TaxID=5850 RepID=A0A5K1U305_PLAKH|nr:tetratricopeptide repeat protein, putative [Plasmodium knowlesi strain H]OTN65164.1 Uncharacterized protein PKNOH_S120124900 [Plasmodium knowlesi]CAA9988115.1 tetratricopeptide repeat protein, putative [Plasmodium knowlesi strain H]SBO19990.1 conserved Plasmodium protein, unknown function [Plasmodium knowlesi strain H]SBO29118.1 conserved Plasmodium protein, unknown function [Plasmodium knowlesi strain H]VVS77589.1 tetratricopeptide repeat protein, putative [Plasmodium knowlesi strain H]|eukprot:XP_002259089.1 hypothetical protein, conserved in Plasmodium species [Plasmodium knowlesi strain H]
MEDDFHVDEEYIKQLSEKYKNAEHPLFMDELPANIEENEDLHALYNLMIDDEDELSLAKNFKQVGNDYYQDGTKYFEDAIISYTKGIDILTKYWEDKNLEKRKAERGKLRNDSNSSPTEGTKSNAQNVSSQRISNGVSIENGESTAGEEAGKPAVKGDSTSSRKGTEITVLNGLHNEGGHRDDLRDNEIRGVLADLHCNRAIVHYKKKRYVKCLQDCRKAYAFNQTKFKSVYYSILCSYHLELYKDAHMYVNRFEDMTKSIDLKNHINLNEYEKMKEIIFKKYEDILERKKVYQNEKRKAEENEKNVANLVQDILHKRNIQMVENVYQQGNNVIPVLYVDTSMYIHFTVFLLYFERAIMETIIDFAENQSIMDHYDIVKKNKNNHLLFCYIEFPYDVFFMIHSSSYICDVLNRAKLFSPILSIHIIENEEANRQFRSGKTIKSIPL